MNVAQNPRILFIHIDGTAVNEEHLKAAPPTIKRYAIIHRNICNQNYRAILEAIRLRSPGMIARKVTEPIKIKVILSLMHAA